MKRSLCLTIAVPATLVTAWLMLTLLASAQPVITRSPTNLSLSLGATATFRVSASSTNGALAYRWCFNQSELANANRSSLVLTNIQVTNAGPYSVIVSDSGGSLTSAPASLDVDTTWTKITTDPIVTDTGYDFSAGFWADLDRDGYLDLVLITDRARYNPFYHNNGDGTFTRVLEPNWQSAVAPAWVYSWGDYDNDGYPDWFSPEWRGGKSLLYHNNGDGTFSPITNNPIAQESSRASSGTWVDYDRDGNMDLYVANGAAAGDVLSKNCFYQNQGDGTFLKLTNGIVSPLITEWGYNDLAVWIDIDNDGWQDLFVVRTGNSRNVLYRNVQGRSFTKVTADPLVQELDAHWGDAAWADYDNDGDPDVLLTAARPIATDLGPVAFFQNDGQGHFTKMTAEDVGPLVTERVNTYSACWGDYDNDGWLDLYMANSFIGGETRTDLLYHNNGDGTLSKVTRGSPVNELGAGIGGMLVDLNNDGFLDLYLIKHPAPDNSRARLYMNNRNSNSWISVRCSGTVSPRLGSGTKVRVKAQIGGTSLWQVRVIDPGGFPNGQNFTAHFGLGAATNVDLLRIEWTSGITQELTNVPVKQYLTITEPTMLAMVSPGELHVPCWKGMGCGIEGSTDLLNWTALAVLTNLNVSGGIQWTDPAAAGMRVRFYRVELRDAGVN